MNVSWQPKINLCLAVGQAHSITVNALGTVASFNVDRTFPTPEKYYYGIILASRVIAEAPDESCGHGQLGQASGLSPCVVLAYTTSLQGQLCQLPIDYRTAW